MGLFDRIKNVFRSEANDNEDDNSLELRLQTSLKEAETNKKNAWNEIKKLDEWARDAILDAYADFFPNGKLSYYRDQYKKSALENYQKIKQEHGGKLDSHIVDKCEQIVVGYLNQMSLMESQAKLFDKMYDEYSSSLKKLKAIAHKTNELNEHSERLTIRENDTTMLAAGMSGEYQLEDIKREVAIKEEYFKQLDQLKQEYGDDRQFNNALTFKAEVDKMITELDD